MIQEYLLRETTELKERNTFLSEQFLKNIGTDIQKTFEGDIKKYLDKKKSDISEEMSNFRLEEYTNREGDLAKIDIEPTVERLGSDSRARPAQLSEIQSSYNTIGKDVMDKAFQDYADADRKSVV